MEKSTQLPVITTKKISIRTQLIVFFVLSFLISWICWLPLVINPRLPQPLSIIGLFAPALSAILVAAWAEGKNGVARLLGRYRIWRFSLFWYLFALLIIPVIYTLALFFAIQVLHMPSANLFFANTPIFLFIAYVYLMVINSGEEIGWRGFALPLLEKAFSRPVFAGLLLGLLWALWHYPLFIYPDLATMPYPIFIVFIVGLSMIYMHLFRQTKGSLWPAVMLHAATDMLPRIVQLTKFGQSFWIVVSVVVWLVAILMTVFLKFDILKKQARA